MTRYYLDIHGSRDMVHVRWREDVPTMVEIGCKAFDIDGWLADYITIGRAEGYSEESIEEYGEYLRQIAEVDRIMRGKAAVEKRKRVVKKKAIKKVAKKSGRR